MVERLNPARQLHLFDLWEAIAYTSVYRAHRHAGTPLVHLQMGLRETSQSVRRVRAASCYLIGEFVTVLSELEPREARTAG